MKLSQLTSVGQPPYFDINLYVPQKIAFCGIESLKYGNQSVPPDFIYSVFSAIRRESIAFNIIRIDANQADIVLDKPILDNIITYHIKCNFITGLD